MALDLLGLGRGDVPRMGGTILHEPIIAVPLMGAKAVLKVPWSRVMLPVVGVWRSPEAHLHGVQGAASSNLATPTISPLIVRMRFVPQEQCLGGTPQPSSLLLP